MMQCRRVECVVLFASRCMKHDGDASNGGTNSCHIGNTANVRTNELLVILTAASPPFRHLLCREGDQAEDGRYGNENLAGGDQTNSD
jgi:hypothetical protein